MLHNSVTTHGYRIATDFFRHQLPPELGIRQGQVLFLRFCSGNGAPRGERNSIEQLLAGNMPASSRKTDALSLFADFGTLRSWKLT
jgi:hypothetical protein